MEFDTILVRYGEIGLKSDQTRPKFVSKLEKNIKAFLKRENIKAKIIKDWGRLFVETADKNAIKVLQNVFGIISVSPVLSCQPNLKAIEEVALGVSSFIKKTDSFAVSARREGNHDFTSIDVEREIGGAVQDETQAKVDLSNPDKVIQIEVRQKEAFVFTEVYAGPGGLPYGVEGTVLAVFGKNIDKAIWLMGKRGCEVELVCLEKDKAKVELLIKKLEPWFIGIKLHTVKNIFKDAEALANKTNAKALVTGADFSSLEQFKEEDASVSLPIFRPLAGFTNKEKIPV